MQNSKFHCAEHSSENDSVSRRFLSPELICELLVSTSTLHVRAVRQRQLVDQIVIHSFSFSGEVRGPAHVVISPIITSSLSEGSEGEFGRHRMRCTRCTGAKHRDSLCRQQAWQCRAVGTLAVPKAQITHTILTIFTPASEGWTQLASFQARGPVRPCPHVEREPCSIASSPAV